MLLVVNTQAYMTLKGLLNIYVSGWGRREICWVNNFWAALTLGILSVFVSQRLGSIFLIALYWLGCNFLYWSWLGNKKLPK